MRPDGLRTIPVPTTGRGNVAGLCAALYDQTQRPDCPESIRSAARELCRDYHVMMLDMATATPTGGK